MKIGWHYSDLQIDGAPVESSGGVATLRSVCAGKAIFAIFSSESDIDMGHQCTCNIAPRDLYTGFYDIEKYGSSSAGGSCDGFKTDAVVLISAQYFREWGHSRYGPTWTGGRRQWRSGWT